MKVALLLIVAIAALAYVEAGVVSDSQGADVRTDVSPNAVQGVGDKLNPKQNQIVGHLVEAAEEVKKEDEKKPDGITEIKQSVNDILEDIIKKIKELLDKISRKRKRPHSELGDIKNDILDKAESVQSDLESDKEEILNKFKEAVEAIIIKVNSSNSERADSSGSMSEESSSANTADIQKSVAADLDLKMMMMEDGTPKGKCYCSCNLNNQPVFMEIDSSNLPGTYALV